MAAANLDGGAGLSAGAVSRKARTKGGVVTIVTVLSLFAAMGLTWFGLSLNDQVSANFDASSWLWSMTKGEVARVNGLTGKVDTRTDVPNSRGHLVQVSQSDRFLILRDVNTGKVMALDPATLGITATLDSQQGLGVTIALDGESAFIIDPVQGVVRQLDPATLQPVGEPLRYPPGITGGRFDGQGRLWIAIPSQGTVSAITAAPLTPPSGGSGGSSGPSLVRTEPVAEAAHDLQLSALDSGVAVLDQTNGVLTAIRGDQVQQVTVSAAAGGQLPARTSGSEIPITVAESRKVFVVAGDQIRELTVPGSGGSLSPAVAWAGRFYVADDGNGIVYVLDASGKALDSISFTNPGGALELEVRENHLFINAPGSASARVVDDQNQVKVVDKFADDILGGDPPPAVPPPPPPKPLVGPPSAPKTVVASAGDGQVRLSWTAAPHNGSAITKYIIEGGGQTITAGASQRSVTVKGLTNGEKYTFTVKAVNGKGTGPTKQSNAVMPTRDVPDAPTELSATANPDGTVTVKWTAANAQGRKISKYEVTAISDGGSVLIGTSPSASLTIEDGTLEYGTQYAFTVVAINDINAGSEPSEVSESVVPFNKPTAVGSLTASTVAETRGTIRVAWNAATDNGRPIEGYDVTANGNTQRVTATGVALNGFADGEIVTVTVVAVNEAGPGPESTTSAKTIEPPTVSGVGTQNIGYNSMRVHFAYTDGGGTPTCTLTINGSPRTIGCNTGAAGYTVTGLWPNQVYNYTVKVANAAAEAVSAQQSPRTDILYGWARCIGCANGVWSYRPNGSGVLAQDNTCCGSGTVYRDNTRVTPTCKKRGGVTANSENRNAILNSAGENSNKRSDWWVKINDTYFLPYAYVNLEAYSHTATDNIGLLPTC